MRAIRNIVHGLGGLGAIVVVFLGYRGVQVNAYLASAVAASGGVQSQSGMMVTRTLFVRCK